MKSVKFDPFTFLSLPLPMDSATNMEIIGRQHTPPYYTLFFTLCSLSVVRLDGSQPVRYCLRQGMDDKYRRVKENVSVLTDISVSQFVLVDVYGGIVRVRHSRATNCGYPLFSTCTELSSRQPESLDGTQWMVVRL